MSTTMENRLVNFSMSTHNKKTQYVKCTILMAKKRIAIEGEGQQKISSCF